ncbi:MAG: hypothetical protein WAT79_16780 [Saprospiraceae bacterium]
MKNVFLSGCIILIVGLTLFSCKSKSGDDGKVETPLFETKEFMEFYDRFSKDSVFQMEHIVFPLEGIRSPRDESDTLSLNHLWQKEDWFIHGKFDDANGTFSVEMFDLAGKMVIEVISDESGSYSMERRFAKLSDGWNLIFYKEMGKYK